MPAGTGRCFDQYFFQVMEKTGQNRTRSDINPQNPVSKKGNASKTAWYSAKGVTVEY